MKSSVIADSEQNEQMKLLDANSSPWHRLWAVSLAWCLALGPVAPGFAQNTPVATLRVTVVGGSGAFNNMKAKLGRDIEIEVRDEAGKAIGGADVTFTPRPTGASVTFRGGTSVYTTRTDEMGRAQTIGLTPNDLEGRFPIEIRAVKNGVEGSATTYQSNTLAGGVKTATGKPAGGGKKVLLLVVGAAAAGGVAAAVGRGKSSGSGATPVPATTASIGGVTVGAPR